MTTGGSDAKGDVCDVTMIDALYILLIIGLNIASRGRFWGLVMAVGISACIVFAVSWRDGEIETYAGCWYVFVWSIILAALCCLIWICCWGVRRKFRSRGS